MASSVLAAVAVMVMVNVAACGGGGGETPADAAIDAPPDAPPPLVGDEAADCGGDPIAARTGDLKLIITQLEIPALGDSFDLDGDAVPSNKLASISSLTRDPIATGLQDGTLVAPIEIFDRDGDPDACVKLALYRGACQGTCNFTDGTQDTIAIDPASFESGGVPISRMRSMATDAAGMLTAEPGVLHFAIPLDGAEGFVFPVTVHVVQGTLSATGLTSFKVGGTMQSFRLDQVLAPPNVQIGIMPGDTLLDAFFANLLGPLVALPKDDVTNCRTADIDIDRDGLEAFCDSNPDDEVKRIDTCIDGDGTVVIDGAAGVASCTDAMVGGVRRFPDGISAAFLFDAGPVTIAP